MAVDAEFVERPGGRSHPLDPVTRERLFDGMCLHAEEVTFAAVLSNLFCIKSGSETADAAGCALFRHETHGGRTTPSAVRRFPDSARHGGAALLGRVRIGLKAGRRATAERARESARKPGGSG